MGAIFFNGAELKEKQPDLKGAFDGMAIDKQGNLFATGPGGVLILSPQGKHLGTILTGEATANCKFGGPDGAPSTSPPTCTWRASHQHQRGLIPLSPWPALPRRCA